MTNPPDLRALLAESPTTDLDRGRLLLRYLRATGREILYADAEESYYLWDGSGPWKRTSPTAVRRAAHGLHDEGRALVEDMRRAIRADGASLDGFALQERSDRVGRVQRVAETFGNGRTIDAALREMRADPSVAAAPGDLDADPDLLGVRNGVVDLRTGTLRPYTATDRISRVVDVDYDPAAVAPRFDDFLDEILVDPEGKTDRALVDFMRRLIGYGITGHTSEQRLPIFYGEGANGKGTLLQSLSALFSEHAADAAFETFEHRAPGAPSNDLADLHGARLVFASEGSEGSPMAEAILKRVTGGDPITARHLYRPAFTYLPAFLLILSTNHRPTWAGSDAAIWRRVLLVPFLANVPEHQRDGDLKARLREEFPGILTWAVRGAVEWHREGLAVPEAVTAATSTYREESHPLADYLAECCEVTAVYSDAVARGDFLTDYQSWCAGIGESPLGVRKAVDILAAVDGVTKTSLHGVTTFRGLRLLPPAERTARARAASRPLSAVA